MHTVRTRYLVPSGLARKATRSSWGLVINILLVVNLLYIYLIMSLLLLIIPLIGIGLITIETNYGLSLFNEIKIKSIALLTSIINLIISLVMFIIFDFSSKSYSFIEEHYQISYFDIYLGVDGLSIYFVLLTTIIMPIAILSN